MRPRWQQRTDRGFVEKRKTTISINRGRRMRRSETSKTLREAAVVSVATGAKAAQRHQGRAAWLCRRLGRGTRPAIMGPPVWEQMCQLLHPLSLFAPSLSLNACAAWPCLLSTGACFLLLPCLFASRTLLTEDCGRSDGLGEAVTYFCSRGTAEFRS